MISRVLTLFLLFQSAWLTAQPVILNQPASRWVLNGGSAVLKATVFGAGPYTCQWQFNGTNLVNNVITTIAGTGTNGFSGDGGPALGSMLWYPYGLAVDAGGNVFVADGSNHRVRRVDTNGIITTVAGNGTNGFSGDGGPATNAMLGTCYGIAVDKIGNLYLADYGNNLIRKVDTNGVIITVAASNAGINQPRGLAVDGAGNLFVADTGNYRVHKVDPNGVVSVVAGKNSSIYGGDGGLATNGTLNPYAVTVDTNGNLYIADYNNNRIRRVDGVSGIITTVAGTNFTGFTGDGGLAVNARLYRPAAVYADGLGNLLIWDAGNGRIRQIDANGIITTVAGNGSTSYSGDGGAATNAGILLGGMTSDAYGSLYVADDTGGRIRQVATSKLPYLALNAVTTNNAGTYDVIISNATGSVTSSVATVSVVFPPALTAATADVFVTNGSPATLMASVSGTAPFGCQWYVYPATGLAGATNATLTYAAATTNQNGYYFCVVTNAYSSVTSRVAALTVVVPPGIGVQPSNQVVAAGQNITFGVVATGTGPFRYQWQLNGTNLPANDLITTVAGNGTNGYLNDGLAATNAELSQPIGVAVDGAGNLYIADYGNNRVRKVDTNGVITTVAGTGINGESGNGGLAVNAQVSYVQCVALDASNNLYLGEIGGRVRKVDTNGIISLVAGGGNQAVGTANLVATNANLFNVTGLAVDSGGNLFMANSSSYGLVKASPNGLIKPYANLTSHGLAADAAGNIFDANGIYQVHKVDTNGVATVFAGSGAYGDSGDGGPAVNASLRAADGVAVDMWGNAFIADHYINRIREVAANGVITTVAGSEQTVYYGDGGLAIKAGFNQPYGVAVDAAGNLFIADRNSQRIRKVNLAGSPALTLYGVNPARALLSSSLPANSIYAGLNGAGATNAGNFSVVVTSPYGSVTSSIAALTVGFAPSITAQPASVTTTNGGQATFSVVAAGTGPLGYQWYFNTNTVLAGANGSSLPMSSVGNGQTGTYFCVITNAYASITSPVVRLAIGLPPTITSSPTNLVAYGGGKVSLGVAVVGTGPFSYQWQLNGSNLPNNIITTVAGNGLPAYSGDGGPATNAGVLWPSFINVDAGGALYIADWSSRIRKVDTNGIIHTVAGNGSVQYSGDGVAATASAVGFPSGVAADGYGNLFVGDTYNYRVREVDAGGIIQTVAGSGTIQIAVGDGGAAINAGMYSPYGLIVDPTGNLYIADAGNHRVRRVSPDGIIQTVAGVGPYVSSNGGYAGDGGAATNARLNAPYGLAMDKSGNLYIADQYSHVVRKIDTNGVITTVAGNAVNGFAGDGGAATNASFSFPMDVKVDSAGNLYVADSRNNRIRRVDMNGIISTLAGTGTNANVGDGGPATNAALSNPTGLALDLAGNLFVGDYSNNCVRVISLAGTPEFTLNSVNPANAGIYSVVVSNPYGSVTNKVANLDVILLPRNFSVSVGGRFAVNLQFNGTPGHAYVLQTATNLAPPVNWLPVITKAADAGGNWSFTDTNSAPATQRFYRALP